MQTTIPKKTGLLGWTTGFWLSLLAAGLIACNKDADKADAATADSLQTPTTSKRILGVARIEPEEGILNITAGTTGNIVRVLMNENQPVQKGQSLLTVEVAVETAQLAQAQSKLAAQQAAIRSNAANLEAMRVQLRNARDTYARNIKLYEAKAQTKQALEDSKAEVDRLEKEVEAARATLAQSQSRLGELKADINYYQTLVRQKKVTAPEAGKILNVLVDPGDYVTSDTKIAELAAGSTLIAKTEIDELYAERVQVGQPAVIISQTTGDTLARGTVSFAADYLKQKSLFKDQSTELEDRRVREVHVRLEKGKMPLIGSRVDCLILVQ
ncbi:hypothetical protein GCM10023187_30280 [Nibrella viscosa]|uniref:Multidrug resistance protein MdtA-like barrel-sandwich hybrid domain-containing protein n=1 Tax=Nibrella viscosa TaxID=1084524 RepID=A0ABP8KK73_9BACT